MFIDTELHKLESLIAQAAEAELVARLQNVDVQHKADGSWVTGADVGMQNCLQRMLAEHWPNILLLGEEMTAEQQQALLQQTEQPLWIVDPLDGTSNYAAGTPFFASSVALMHAGQIIAGVVFDPIRRESFSALRGQGAWLNQQPLQLAGNGQALQQAIALIDLKRLPKALAQAVVQQPPYHSQRNFGSVALDWCWLAAGRVQVYVHGGQKLWDYAAGHLCFQEAGGCGDIYTDYQGTVAENLNLQPRIGIAASDAGLYTEWQAWLAGHAS